VRLTFFYACDGPDALLFLIQLEPVLDLVVVLWSVLARGSICKVVTRQGQLIEHGLVAAHEAPLVVVDLFADLVDDGLADVKDLAVVVDVCVEAVGQALASEAGVERVNQHRLGSVGEQVTPSALGLWSCLGHG